MLHAKLKPAVDTAKETVALPLVARLVLAFSAVAVLCVGLNCRLFTSAVV